MCCILMYKHNKAVLPTLFNDVFVLPPMTHKNIAQGRNSHINYRSTEQSADNYLCHMSDQKYGTPLS